MELDGMEHVFNKIQDTVSTHGKGCYELRKIQENDFYGSDNHDKFLFRFIKNLNHILVARRRDEWAEKSMVFIISFMHFSYQKDKLEKSSLKKTLHCTFMEFFIKYLLKGINSKDKNVRVRICRLLSHCIENVDELDDELFMEYKTKMIERMKDKEHVVRVHATNGIVPLMYEYNDVLIVLLHHMSHDPHGEVRINILKNMDVTEDTIESIISRCGDVDVNIRKFVYKNILINLDFRLLSAECAKYIIGYGLYDASGDVRRHFLCVVKSWLKMVDNDIVVLISYMDPLHCETLTKDLIILCLNHTDDSHVVIPEISLTSLTVEKALFMKVYLEFLYKNKNGANITHGGDKKTGKNKVPTDNEMVEYVDLCIRSGSGEMNVACNKDYNENSFIFMQILEISVFTDFDDECARIKICNLLRNLLMDPKTQGEMIDKIMKLLVHILPSFTDLLGIIIDVICTLKDIFCTLIKTDKNGGSSIVLDPMSEGLEVKILAYIRCMDILKTFLLNIDGIHIETKTLYCFLNELVIPIVNSDLAVLQLSGLKCLGLICLLYKPFAVQYLALFIEFYKLSALETQLASLEIIIDILTVFGLSMADETSNQVLLDDVFSSLYNINPSIQLAAVKGFSRLILMKKLDNIEILKYLFFLYFYSQDDDNFKLRQCLVYFVQAFSSTSTGNQEAVATITLIIIKSLIISHRKQYGGSNTHPDLVRIIRQLLLLSDPNFLVKKDQYSREQLVNRNHQYIAMEILKEMDESLEYARVFCLILSRLRVKGGEESVNQEIISYIKCLMTRITDKMVLNGLVKLHNSLILSKEDYK